MVSPLRLPIALEEYSQSQLRQMIDDLEQAFLERDQIIKDGYQMSNVTATRVLDADSTTVAEVADVLGTLIDDMKARGLLAA